MSSQKNKGLMGKYDVGIKISNKCTYLMFFIIDMQSTFQLTLPNNDEEGTSEKSLVLKLSRNTAPGTTALQ